ncbi:MAG: hypothetical protein AAB834_07680, partial [Patescibacteria group bacterium]
TDYISGKPIANAEVVNEETNALSDKSGKVILTVDDMEATKLSMTIHSKGYRSETIELDATAAGSVNVVLVLNQKDIFVSKQRGTYDVYSMDLDGKNRRLLLAGTGSEAPNMSLVISPDGDRAALVSTRDAIRDNDGYMLSALTIIDVQAGTNVTVDHAAQIQLIDWVGNRLIYRSTTAGASASDSQRNRLVAYSYESNARIQLATANQFNTILSAKGLIYYGVSSTDQQATLGLFKVKPDGSDRKRLSEDEVWTGVRSTYNTFSLQTPEAWYTYSIKDGHLDKAGTPPSLTAAAFVDDSKAERSVWTDLRDGKGTLLLYDIHKDTYTTLKSQEGLAGPVRWASDMAVIYRVSTKAEIADYVISPDGGEAHKIADVTGTYGYASVY